MDRLKTVTAVASGISNTYSYTDQSGNVTDSLQSISNGGKMNSPYATLRAPRLNVAFEQRQFGTVTLFNNP